MPFSHPVTQRPAGGIYNRSGAASVRNSIIASNASDLTTNDVDTVVPVNSSGFNLIGSDGGGNGFTNGVNGDLVGTPWSPISPLLAALGNYGGLTQTRPPLPGSPVLDAGGSTTLATDQRGLPRLSGLQPDIGATELQVVIAANSPVLTGATRGGDGSITFGFTNSSGSSGASFTVFASTNLGLPLAQWSNLGPANESPVGSGQFQFADPQATNNPQRFYRVRSP